MATAPKRIVGKPFQKGDDPRRNRAGRPKALLTAALAETLTDDDARAIMKQVILDARGGDLQAIAMLWDRLEGKPIGRNEQGAPGEFTGLEDKPLAELIDLAQRRV
jgi:hypothetical protein